MTAAAPQPPPIVFTDATGRQWFPVFDDHVVAWLPRCSDFDLDAIIGRDDPHEITGTFGSSNRALAFFLAVASFARAGFEPTAEGWAAARAAMELGVPPHDNAATARAIAALYHALRRRWPHSAVLARVARTLPKFRVTLRERGEHID